MGAPHAVPGHAGIFDVARRAGVSASTVSRSLRGSAKVSAHTRERVLRAAAELHYVPSPAASRLASGRTHAVGVIVPFATRWFFSEVLTGVEGALRDAGYDLLLYNVGDPAGRVRFFATMPLHRRVDAVLAVASSLDPAEQDALRALRVPLAVVGGPIAGFSRVGVDDRAGAVMAVRHLLLLGHRDIVMISGEPADPVGRATTAARRAGFETALAEAGIDGGPDRVVPELWGVGGGMRAVEQLLTGRTLPTAIFAESDEMALERSRCCAGPGSTCPGGSRWSASTTTRWRRPVTSPRSPSRPAGRASSPPAGCWPCWPGASRTSRSTWSCRPDWWSAGRPGRRRWRSGLATLSHSIRHMVDIRPPSGLPAEQLRQLVDTIGPLARARLGALEGEAFLARLEHVHPDVVEPLEILYGTRTDTAGLVRELVGAALDAAAVRPWPLRVLDRRREVDPTWFQRAGMVGYACYADRFAGTLAGVRERLDYLAELGVTYLHLMPLLGRRTGRQRRRVRGDRLRRGRPAAGHDGRPGGARGRPARPRHGAVRRPGAQPHRRASTGGPAGRRPASPRTRTSTWYSRTGRSPTRTNATLPEVFPDTAPGSFTHVPEIGGWVWTTFHDYQWDLDYTNPAVFAAMLRTMLELANHGVDVLRLDAVAVPVEADRHGLPEPARGAPAGPGVPGADPTRRARRAVQGGGDRRPGDARAVSRRARPLSA